MQTFLQSNELTELIETTLYSCSTRAARDGPKYMQFMLDKEQKEKECVTRSSRGFVNQSKSDQKCCSKGEKYPED